MRCFLSLLASFSIEPKGYGFLFYAKNMVRNIGKAIAKGNKFTWYTHLAYQKLLILTPPKNIFLNKKIFRICLKEPIFFLKKKILTLT